MNKWFEFMCRYIFGKDQCNVVIGLHTEFVCSDLKTGLRNVHIILIKVKSNALPPKLRPRPPRSHFGVAH